MHRPVRFPEDIEPLVQFIEETDPGQILEATLGKLRGGLSVKKLLTASALAVTRSSDLPPGHHGGPLHPLVGLHALAIGSRILCPPRENLGVFGHPRAVVVLDLVIKRHFIPRTRPLANRTLEDRA